MLKRDLYGLLFNAAGILSIAAVGIYVVRSAVFTEQLAQCSTRYQAGTELSLAKSGGRLFSPIELQADLGTRSRNLVENAEVIPVSGGPAPAALLVRMRYETANGKQAITSYGNGVGFEWRPRVLGDAHAACLKYSVYVPEDFDFGGSGRLPGIAGRTTGVVADNGFAGFAGQITWNDTGELAVMVQGHDDGHTFVRTGTTLPKGRWADIEQEVELNTPGDDDGVVRIWLDGKLVADNPRLTWRNSDDAYFTHVLADIGYGVDKAMWRAGDARGEIRVSPPQISLP